MSTILEVNELNKNYKSVQALKGLNMQVEKGMVFGILGPNGSGKTTTLGILLGILNPTSGSFSWFGNGMADDNRKRIGSLLETPNFFPYLNAVQNLKIVAQIKQMTLSKTDLNARIDEVLEIVDLTERKKSKFKTFSLGMKQRLAIASALLSDPEVLVLDEPTNGLDPQGIAEIRNLIIEISKEGKTILIASHQLDEIEKVCTDVIILKKGQTIRQSKIDSLMDDTVQLTLKAEDMKKLRVLIDGLETVKLIQDGTTGLILELDESTNPEAINKYCFENGVVLSELRQDKKSLETQFLEITKE